jgi:hypothetical protein
VFGKISAQVAACLYNIGQVYMHMQSFPKALDYLYNSATIYRSMRLVVEAQQCDQNIQQICAQSATNPVTFDQKYIATYVGAPLKIRFFRLSDDPSTAKAHVFTNSNGAVDQLIGVVSGNDIEVVESNTASNATIITSGILSGIIGTVSYANPIVTTIGAAMGAIGTTMYRYLFPNTKFSQLTGEQQRAALNSLYHPHGKVEVITGKESGEIMQLKIFDPR